MRCGNVDQFTNLLQKESHIVTTFRMDIRSVNVTISFITIVIVNRVSVLEKFAWLIIGMEDFFARVRTVNGSISCAIVLDVINYTREFPKDTDLPIRNL